MSYFEKYRTTTKPRLSEFRGKGTWKTSMSRSRMSHLLANLSHG